MTDNAKERLQSIARHLTNNDGDIQRPKFELEEHPVDLVRALKVNLESSSHLGYMLTSDIR